MDNHLKYKEQGQTWLKATFGGNWVFFQCTHDEESNDFSYSYLYEGSDQELAELLKGFIPISLKEEASLGVKQIFYRQLYTKYPIQLVMTSSSVWISLLSEVAWNRLTRGTKSIAS